MRRGSIALIVPFALTFVAGCQSVGALKKRCLAGETSACEEVCEEKVAGEGGCYHAGEHHRARAAGEHTGPEWKKASQYFERSCQGRHAEGCLLAAEMMDAPYVVTDPSGKGVPAVMGDAELVEREKRLTLACDLGSARACKRLGDALIGRGRDRALKAYQKACDAGSEPAACRAAREREVELADRWSLSCRNGVADDCTRLGDLLHTVDVPRALKLFVTECQLRGVEAHVGGMAAFLSDRVRRVRPGLSVPAPAAQLPEPTTAEVGIAATAITGQVAAVEVDRKLALLRRDVARCGPKSAAGTLALRLVVDRTGDVFRAEATQDALPPAVASCIVAAFEATAFTPPPAGLAQIDVMIRLGHRDTGGEAPSAPASPTTR